MKRRLTTDDMITFFAVTDHCGNKVLVDNPTLMKCNEVTCPGCGIPIMFRGSDGLWYKAGARIFD